MKSSLRYVYVCMHACMYVCMYVSKYVCMYVSRLCMHIWTYQQIYACAVATAVPPIQNALTECPILRIFQHSPVWSNYRKQEQTRFQIHNSCMDTWIVGRQIKASWFPHSTLACRVQFVKCNEDLADVLISRLLRLTAHAKYTYQRQRILWSTNTCY